MTNTGFEPMVEPTTGKVYTTIPKRHLYSGSYNRMWLAEGAKCEHAQYRRDRVTLYCARPKGHGGNHLHDVHPIMQTGEVGRLAREKREAENLARYGR